MAAFEQIPNVGTKDVPSTPFLAVTQAAVSALESITAAEKAQAVPHIRIWQIDPRSGLPVHGRPDAPSIPAAPLTTQLVEPPGFGASVDDSEVSRFRERPNVSLERISIKTENPRGLILFRQIDLSFVIHRPEAVFEETNPARDSWATIILPGTVYVLEYGWRASSGVRNGLLNGEGFDGSREKPAYVVPGLRRIRFTVVNYGFTIMADYQIKVQVHGLEDGEFNMRQAGFAAAPAPLPSERRGPAPRPGSSSILPRPPVDAYSEEGLAGLNAIQAAVAGLKPDGKGFITFQQLADAVFAPSIDRTYRELGYSDVRLFLGNFNHRAGRTAPVNGGVEMSDRPLGEFMVPLKDVQRTFGEIVKAGQQLTLYNFLTPFLTIFRDPRVWDRRNVRTDDFGDQLQRIPEVVIRSIINRDVVLFYVFDVNREFTRFTSEDRTFGLDGQGDQRTVTRSELRQKLSNLGIPIISFMRANSYVADANFEVQADDQIKSIFIRRALRPDRSQVVEQTDKSRKAAPGQDGGLVPRTVDPRQVLYSSAIHGDITMLGNFALDVFGLIWLDFGVRVWSGPFFVMSREDVLEPGSFTTHVNLQSSGDDPLGTQGRSQVVALQKQQESERRLQQARDTKRPR